MDITEYLEKLEDFLKFLESKEAYEECRYVFATIKTIKNDDYKTYVALTFDVDKLVEQGFFKGNETLEEARDILKDFFGLKSIYDYSLITGDIICCLSDRKHNFLNP